MTYKRVDLNDPVYAHVKAALGNGGWACDSDDHNEESGCSNPTCFKFNGTKEAHVVSMAELRDAFAWWENPVYQGKSWQVFLSAYNSHLTVPRDMHEPFPDFVLRAYHLRLAWQFGVEART